MNRRARFSRLTPFSAPPEPGSLWPVALALGMAVAIFVMVVAARAGGASLSPTTWHLTRAAGVTLYLLFWLVTLLGLGLTTTLLDRAGGRAVLYSVHRFATELAYGFLALHIITLAIDSTEPFRPAALLVPFTSGWREPWTGLGVIGAELMVVIGVSFGMRRWIGQRGWKWLHLLAFPAYAMSLAHAIGSGSDAGSWPLQLIYLTTGCSILWLALFRLMRGPARSRPAWSVRRRAAWSESIGTIIR